MPGFEEKTSIRTKEANERSKAEQEYLKHSQHLYQNPGDTMTTMLVLSKSTGILANDKSGIYSNRLGTYNGNPRLFRDFTGSGEHGTYSAARERGCRPTRTKRSGNARFSTFNAI
jgi:hypothetical protein